MKKVAWIAVLAGMLLQCQTPPPPSATVAQDSTTGQITAVVSTSKSNRIVCKYSPLPAGPAGPYATLNINCIVNGKPYAVYYVQLNAPYQAGVQGETFSINANGNMSITALFTPVIVLAPGTTNAIGYQIAANGSLLQGVFK